MTHATHMRREIAEIPEAVARLLDRGAPAIAGAAAALAQRDPLLVATVARGSSDHAAAYLKYAVELVLGLPVASLGPSVASIYGRTLRLERAAVLAISQSGRSPDIVAMLESAQSGGATTLALTNTAASPLAEAAEFTLDLHAGTERSVAATKSFVASVAAGLALLARWSADSALATAVAALPGALARALACDWSDFAAALDGEEALYVLGRGPGFAIACEAALKFKETAALKAEAYSAAEVMHGPVAIVTPGFPVLALAARDAAEASVADIAHTLAAKGARAFLTADRPGPARPLPFAATGHPLTDPLALIVSFYGFVEALARRRGLDPDSPRLLSKVTETL